MKFLTLKLALTTTGVIMSLLLSAFSLVAQTSTTKTSAATGFGVIKGRVVNEAGQPLANAIVTAARFDSQRSDQYIATDREGRFELTGLEAVTYRLGALFPAYTSLLADADVEEVKYRTGDNVTLVLIKGGVITGTVTNPNGEPVVGIRVRARMIRAAGRLAWPQRFMPNSRYTDDRGIYRIYGLPPGTYVVSAGGTSEQVWQRSDPFAADLPIYAPEGTRDTAEEITVRAGEETSNIDIHYLSQTGRTISGKATAPNSTEMRGFGVMLTPAKDGNDPGFTTGQEPGNKGFVFRGVADGDYDIKAFSANATGDFMWSESKRIKVNGADVTGVELLTQPLSAVSGKVVLQESKAVECATDKQRPVFSETLVAALSKTSKFEVPFFSSGSPINADAEGNLLLKNLLPGQYYFGAQFFGKSWYLDSVTLPVTSATESRIALQAKPVDAAKTWTTLKSGVRLSGLTVTLTQGAASVQGEIAAREGGKQSVYLVPIERERADDVLRFFTTVVSGEGKVELSNVAPGRYWVLVTPEVISLSKLRSPDGLELRSKLRREAEAAKSEIELKPCQNVTNFQPQKIQK